MNDDSHITFNDDSHSKFMAAYEHKNRLKAWVYH